MENNFIELNDIVVENPKDDDTFLMHSSLYEVETQDGNLVDVIFGKFDDKQFSMTVLPRLLQSIKEVEPEIPDFTFFDQYYQLYNAFYGINFDGLDLKRCITGRLSYEEFRQYNIFDVDASTLWERREQLFDKLIFCNTVEDNLHTIGAAYLLQIITKLQELNRYVKANWTDGDFNYVDANANTSLRISPESKITMSQKKYVNERTFSLPDGRRECFELHIKTGNLRFHFFPENLKVYIGYIGKHLPTAKFN